MDKSLDETKTYLAGKYLGQAGIHSIGISRKENGIRVYLEQSAADEQSRVLKEIEAEATPYKIIIVQSNKPTAY